MSMLGSCVKALSHCRAESVLLLAGLALAPGLLFAQAMPTVTLSYVTENSSCWPAIVAREKRFFEAEGIKVDWVRAGQSAKALQMLAAKASQISNSSVVDTFRAIESGAKVVAFLNGMDAGLHWMIGAKSIKTVQDLKGKRIITGGQGDITNLWWNAMARKHGFDGQRDAQVLFAGSTTNRMAALIAGGVEGAVISPPQSFKLLEQGYSDLGPMAPYLGALPIMTFAVNRDWVAENGKTLAAFVRAHNKATEFLWQNRNEASAILAKAGGTSLEEALKTWDVADKVKSYRVDGQLTDEGLKNAIAALAAAGDIKDPNRPVSYYYDASFVEAAQRR
jgi:ABC-type nitrate/sulfonate/bicarbonate transport system substrate-binding protein